MMADLGALSGSREPDPISVGSGPSGFDPARGDAEMLAILLWDFFGPHDPRTMYQIQMRSFEATDEQVRRYRVCANHIAESLRFYRNIRFDETPASASLRDQITAIIEQVGEGGLLDSETSSQIADRILAAIAMEARQGRDGETRLDPKDDSAGRKASPKDNTEDL